MLFVKRRNLLKRRGTTLAFFISFFNVSFGCSFYIFYIFFWMCHSSALFRYTLDDIDAGNYNPSPDHLDLVKRALDGSPSPLSAYDVRERSVSFGSVTTMKKSAGRKRTGPVVNQDQWYQMHILCITYCIWNKTTNYYYYHIAR